MSEAQTLEIMNALDGLPTEKVAEVRDFVMFLRERYGSQPESVETNDYSDEWTEEDLRDLSIDTFRRLEPLENEADK